MSVVSRNVALMDGIEVSPLAFDARYELPSHLRGACRKDLHRIVMQGFDDRVLSTQSPRSDARCLFRVNGPTLLVRHRADLVHQIPGLRAETVPLLPTLDGVEYWVRAEVSPTIARSQRGALPDAVKRQFNPRGRRMPVPSHEIGDWLVEFLARKGLHARDISHGPRTNVRRTSERAGVIPAIEFRAAVIGGEPLNRALALGLGRGLTYGQGLIVIEDPAQLGGGHPKE